MLPPGRSVLLVAALFLSILPHTATRASSERCRGSWSPLSQRCPLAEDPAEAVSFAMEKHIAGQPLAARAIHKALARNAKRFAQNVGTLSGLVVNLASVGEVFGVQAKGGPATAPRPLFMHFSGPTGVGKSLTADIIAAAVLTGEESEESERCGKLLLQMRAYASTSLEDIEANSQVRYLSSWPPVVQRSRCSKIAYQAKVRSSAGNPCARSGAAFPLSALGADIRRDSDRPRAAPGLWFFAVPPRCNASSIPLLPFDFP